MRTLRKGMRGEDVRYLQYILDIPTTGIFDQVTEDAVKEEQGKYGLVQDGSVGPLTRAAWKLTDFHVHIFDKSMKVWCAGTPYKSEAYPLRTLKEWAKLEKADCTFNLAFFNMKGSGKDKYGPIKGRTLTYVRAKGYDVGYGGTTERITLDNNNIFAGYKVGISNGRTQHVSNTDRRARNATGRLKDGRFFVVQTVTTSTERELVDFMNKNYDVELMLIQDGGGSVGMYNAKADVLIAGEREGINGRPVATVICVKDK